MRLRFPRTSGFTLVEILTALAVLSLIVLMLSSALGVVANTWTTGIGNVDNYSKSRVMLGMMDRDIRAMLMRPDVAAFVDSAGANPAFAFYSRVEAVPNTDNRAVALVQYSLGTGANAYSLQRLAYGLNYSSGAPAPLTLTLNNATSLSDLAKIDAVTQVENLSAGVLVFEWQFVDGAGYVCSPPYNYSSTPPSMSSPPSAPTPFWFDYGSPGASYNPHGVIVSLLVLSNGGYNIASASPGRLLNIQAQFPANSSSLATGETYGQAWNTILQTPPAALQAMPPQVRSGLQVFQRYIPLPRVAQ